MPSHVEAIGTCKLVLSSGFILSLEKTFYIPSFARNLISVSRLVSFGYSFNFSDSCFSLYYGYDVIGNGTLSNCLYCLNLQNDDHYASMHVHENVGIKRCAVNENSYILWHRRLCHISIDRVKRLVNDGVLSTLDFTDFNTCI